MALTKANSDVIDVASVSVGLGADATANGIKLYVDAAVSPKANSNSPILTGTPTAPTPTQGDNSTKLATTAYVQAYDTANSYGPSSKASGPKVWVSTAAPSGGSDGDVWLQYV